MSIPRLRSLLLLAVVLNPATRFALGQQPDDQAGKIKVDEVKPKSIIVRHDYRCTEYGQSCFEVRPPADGYVVAVSVEEGQTVKKGDLLFTLRPPGEGEKEPDDQARAASAAIGPKAPFDNRMFNHFPADLFKAKAQIKDGVFSMRAPDDGVLVQLSRKPGQFVGKYHYMAAVARLDKITAIFKVPLNDCEYALEWFKDQRNSPLKLFLADRSEFPHAAEVLHGLSGFSDEDTVGFAADFPNPDGLPHGGRNGRVSVSRDWKDAIVLPRRVAFRDRNFWLRVYVVDKGHIAHKRPIDVADGTEELLVVAKGIVAGDRIVVEGVGKVRDGDRVE